MTQQFAVLCLLATYVALGTLCAVLLMRLSAPWIAKAGAVAAVSLLYVMTFFGTLGLLGWSVPTALPPRFKLIAARVVEPDQVRGRQGGVHLWVEELDARNLPSGVPRAYLLPYSVELAGKVAAANKEIKAGRAQGGLAQALAPSVGTGAVLEGANVRTATQGAIPGGDPSGGGVLDPTALGGQFKSVDLIPLPPPLLPPKDNP
jgi:hypothetical protein